MKIPKTDSISELAEFWDTHDLTDFEDQLEEVTGRSFARQGSDSVTVLLSADERRVVKEMAAARGIEEAMLIREWVKEKLQQS
jgi:predicted DNA binding CopG/RHH family protein